MLLALQQTRRAFTLVEMLVVLSVVLVLTALVVMATLSMRDKDQVGTGARHLQGYLAIARGKALAERRPVGIRLLPAAQNPPDVPFGINGIDVLDSLVFIHDPGDLADGYVQTWNFHPTTGVALGPTDRLFNRIIAGPPVSGPPFVPYLNFTFTNQRPVAPYPPNPLSTPATGPVLPGDLVEFHGGGQAYSVYPENATAMAFLNRPADPLDGFLNPPNPPLDRTMYFVSQLPPVSEMQPPPGQASRSLLILDRRIDRFIQAPNVATPRVNYRIMRSSRPIPGEAPLPFPTGVFVIAADRTGFYFGPPANGFTRVSLPDLTNAVNRDILFDPSGRVVGAGTEYFVFFVSDVKSALAVPADTNWALVTVYTRTGSVGSYPVDQQSLNGNPYTFAQFGRGGI